MTDSLLGWALIGVALAGWLVLFVIVGASVTLPLTEPRARVSETSDEDPRSGSDCDHDRREVIKRARDGHEAPEWADAIIERCRDCDAYLLDVDGRRWVYDGDGRREVEAF